MAVSREDMEAEATRLLQSDVPTGEGKQGQEEARADSEEMPGAPVPASRVPVGVGGINNSNSGSTSASNDAAGSGAVGTRMAVAGGVNLPRGGIRPKTTVGSGSGGGGKESGTCNCAFGTQQIYYLY